MKNIFICLIFLISYFKITAQKFELGKVSISELQEKIFSKDTNAVAAVLYNKARTRFIYDFKNGFTAIHEYEFRIKIYKKEGLTWANYQVPYYVGYENLDSETLKFSNAVTYNLEKGAIVKTKLNNEGSFKKNINKFWNEASIEMPNVKVGSVIEFKYILKSQNLVKFPIFNFQQDIPVNYAEYISEIPIAYVYKPILRGLYNVKSDMKITSGHGDYIDETYRTRYIDYQQLVSTYIAENIPALKEENFTDNIQNYRLAILYELEKTQFSGQSEKNYAVTWQGVSKTIFEDKNFGKELSERTYFDNDLKIIIANCKTKLEKVNSILKFVQQKMNWNNLNGYSTEKGVKKAYIEGVGNIAEINFILISMLNSAGLNANPVIISTKEHGVPVFPNITGFNYVIAAVEIDGKQVLLDATNKYTTFNILPINTLNWAGRLIKQDGASEEVNLVPAIQSNVNINMMFSIGNNGKIVGKTRIIKTDYEALKFREKFNGVNKESYVEKLENDLGKIQISDYSVDNINTDLSKPITETFTFESDNFSEIVGEKMFINPLLFFAKNNSPFLQEKRTMPIYFGYPKIEKYNILFEIPQDYIIESLPKSMKILMEDKIASFTIGIVSDKNKIKITIATEINAAILSANSYKGLKEYYQKMIDKLSEKIILKKI